MLAMQFEQKEGKTEQKAKHEAANIQLESKRQIHRIKKFELQVTYIFFKTL